MKCKFFNLLVIGGLVLVGFAAAAGAGELSNTLVIAQAEYTFSFDAIYNWSDVNRMSRLAYDPLVQYDPTAKAIVPCVAKRWEISEDGLTYTFWLEEGITFHDGSDLTASDVKYTVERTVAIGEGVSRFLENVTRIEEINDYTIRLELGRADSSLVDALPALYIVNEDGAKANEVDGDWAQAYLRDNDLGSGPYEVVLNLFEQRTVFTKFDAYWKGWEGRNIEKVIWLWITESATQRLMFENGEVDIAMQPGTANLPDFEANPDVVVHSAPSPTIAMTSFRCIHKPLDDVRVRKALTMAIDYDYMQNVVYLGYGKLAQGPVPSTFPYHNDGLPLPTFDLDAAKQLLADAGYPDGGFTLKVFYQSGQEDTVRTLETLQETWGELGVNIEPMSGEWFVQSAMQLDATSEPDVYINLIWPSGVNSVQLLYEFYSGAVKGVYENNSSYWSDPEVDRLLHAAMAEADPATLAGIVKQAQELIVEAAPAAWMVERPYVLVARPYVKGYSYNPAHQQTLDVYNMWLEGKE